MSEYPGKRVTFDSSDRGKNVMQKENDTRTMPGTNSFTDLFTRITMLTMLTMLLSDCCKEKGKDYSALSAYAGLSKNNLYTESIIDKKAKLAIACTLPNSVFFIQYFSIFQQEEIKRK